MPIAKSRLVVLAAFSVLASGCGDDKGVGTPAPDAGVADSGVPDAESDTVRDAEQDAEPACKKVPEHSGIINGATDTEKVDRQPVLPLLKSDGTLPPLP